MKKRLLELFEQTSRPPASGPGIGEGPGLRLDVLADGGMRARAVAQQVMEKVREATGLPTTR